MSYVTKVVYLQQLQYKTPFYRLVIIKKNYQRNLVILQVDQTDRHFFQQPAGTN